MRVVISVGWVLAWAAPSFAIGLLLSPPLLLIWATSGILFGVFLLAAYRGMRTNTVLALISLVYLATSLSGASSVYMQGTMPDARFFAHLDLSTMFVALQAYFWPTLAAVLYFLH
ncbi:hypothetical protein ROA7450_03474 [Roseovarius albus]|uniref:Uncharacterized protein n=1 Tax=Roseovarius albus TaxID=1247867 RepID=A0A1X6ZYV4_9RHOB|nr:hypothetical protein [Roseovarius albus]SLN65621.1 hypothetical protein ROA7450_03474 [Roseovarius albus]